MVELEIPEVQRLPPGVPSASFRPARRHWGIDEYDLAEQRLTSHHFELIDGRFELHSLPFRFAWPAELDLMAQPRGYLASALERLEP